jgi:SAM-dependent methyltransferase
VTGLDLRAGDQAGAETLEIMAAAPRYNRWQYDLIAPWIGRRVLEVGSGIGNMSEHILTGGRERVILTDIDDWYCQRLRERFAGRPEVVVEALTLPDPGAPVRFRAQRLDTVIALNVVEHIEDDAGTLRTMGGLVGPGGRVIILVPALQAIFGSLDEELGHFRRYSRASLGSAFRAGGLRVEQMFWFNRVGVAGWWLNACLRRVKRIPLDQLKAFDRLVPLLRFERLLPLPFGQSLIAIGTPDAA